MDHVFRDIERNEKRRRLWNDELSRDGDVQSFDPNQFDPIPRMMPVDPDVDFDELLARRSILAMIPPRPAEAPAKAVISPPPIEAPVEAVISPPPIEKPAAQPEIVPGTPPKPQARKFNLRDLRVPLGKEPELEMVRPNLMRKRLSPPATPPASSVPPRLHVQPVTSLPARPKPAAAVPGFERILTIDPITKQETDIENLSFAIQDEATGKQVLFDPHTLTNHLNENIQTEYVFKDPVRKMPIPRDVLVGLLDLPNSPASAEFYAKVVYHGGVIVIDHVGEGDVQYSSYPQNLLDSTLVAEVETLHAAELPRAVRLSAKGPGAHNFVVIQTVKNYSEIFFAGTSGTFSNGEKMAVVMKKRGLTVHIHPILVRTE